MYKIIKKIAFVLVVLLVCSNNSVFADDPGIIPIDLNPVELPNPHKPKSPSRVKISACVDDNAVIVSSSVSVMAQITITNDLTGECLFDRVVALAPDYHCFIPNVSGVLTLTVSVGDKTYEGQFVH